MPGATVTPIRPPMPDEPDFQVEHVDPTKLLVDDQVRGDANPDEQLVDSIRAHGILQPPTVAYDPARGGLVIITGHRRVGAAITAGLTVIPVLRRPLAVARDAARLEQQIVENERRTSLTPGDLARGYQRLELFGLTPEDIARHLGEKQTRVAVGITARRSPATTVALDTHPDIDLEQAAIIADFDHDPDTQAELIGVATRNPADFARQVAWRRAVAEADARVTELRQQAADEGVQVVATRGWVDEYWSGDGADIPWGSAALLEVLVDVDPAEHASCPGHAAIIVGTSNAATTALAYVCTDYRAHGHVKYNAGGPPLTPEEIEQRRRDDEQRAAERAAAAERQAVLDANTTARRDWIRDHMNERSRRPDAHLYAALADAAFPTDDVEPYALTTTVHLLTGETHLQYGAFGAQTSPAEERLRELLTGPVTPLRALAAWALSVAEEAPYAPIFARHLDRLQTWGYQLTDIDRVQLDALVEADDETTGADA